MNRSTRLVLSTAVFCLLLSGAAGLVYQVVWMRYLSLFLGHTSYAVVAVLVAFMGGLALGNAWLGNRADSVRRPLALYAWLEIGIAIYALIFPFYYEACHQAYVALARRVEPGSSLLLLFKFLFSLMTILIPTVMMGGTLPVLIKLVTRSLGELRERVATLYFVNSAGAVAGCILADFWWIPAIGLHYTVIAAAVMNLVVGAVGLFVSGWIGEERGPWPQDPAREPQPSTAGEETFTPGELKLAVIGIGISGFVAMLYEVVWTRMLALALGSSTHAFSLMLITFITGIAVGAWIVGRWRSLRRSLDAFGWAELALAGTLLVSLFFYDLVPYWFIRVADLLARRQEAYPFYELLQAGICFGVMFIPTVCLGMTLPLVSRIATVEFARTGRSVGAVFSVNTLGTVLGAVVTGLWLMPWLGLARTLALGIALNAAIGLVVLCRHRMEWRIALRVGIPLGTVVFVYLTGMLFNHGWHQVFTMGLWRIPAPPSVAAYRVYQKSFNIVYYRDGAGSTVSVNMDRQGNRDNLALRVNGKPDASTTTDVPTQFLSAHIPMLLHGRATNVLVVGLGSGMTCAAVMRHPGVERLDIVEISPEVAQAARLFGPYNDDVLDNPKVRLVVDDAKTFLQTTDRKYDVIISEPSNPWMAGVAGVFSREYYESCRDRLNTNGIMAQWVQAYETDDRVLEIVLNTYFSVFPFFSVWEPASSDLILVGSTQAPTVDFNQMQSRFSHPAVKSQLEQIDMFRLPVLLARELISPQNAPFVAPPGTRIHSDYFPILEYVAQRAFFARGGATTHDKFDENLSTRPLTLLGRYLRDHKITEEDFKAFALYQGSFGLPDLQLFRSILARWQREYPDALEPVEMSAKANQAVSQAGAEAARMSRMRETLMRDAETDPDLLRIYSTLLMRAYWWERSALNLPPTEELTAVIERLLAVDAKFQRVHRLRLAELAWDRGDDLAAFELAQKGLDPNETVAGPVDFSMDPPAPARMLTRLIETLWRAGRIEAALDLCRQARDRGYVGRQDANYDPLLDLTCRKVEAAAGAPAVDAQ